MCFSVCCYFCKKVITKNTYGFLVIKSVIIFVYESAENVLMSLFRKVDFLIAIFGLLRHWERDRAVLVCRYIN